MPAHIRGPRLKRAVVKTSVFSLSLRGSLCDHFGVCDDDDDDGNDDDDHGNDDHGNNHDSAGNMDFVNTEKEGFFALARPDTNVGFIMAVLKLNARFPNNIA